MSTFYCSKNPECILPDNHPDQCEEMDRRDWVQGSMASQRFPTHQARTIIEELLPQWERMFLAKNAKYRQVQDDLDLGVKGIYPDLNRKLAIIRERVWFDRETPGEGTKEVIYDLIGHLFLMVERMESSDDVTDVAAGTTVLPV